jgi:hypothetical protein
VPLFPNLTIISSVNIIGFNFRILATCRGPAVRLAPESLRAVIYIGSDDSSAEVLNTGISGVDRESQFLESISYSDMRS